MGTHSTVKFYERGKCMLAIYNQYDGYVAGEGKKILDFYENKNWRGNGFDDEALLYVCYKKNGKPLHTYATTENAIEEFNYEIYDTEDGLRFTIKELTWDDDGEILKTLLRLATFEEFKEFVETEYLRELVFYKHCEDMDEVDRKFYREVKEKKELIYMIERDGWNEVLEMFEEKGGDE